MGATYSKQSGYTVSKRQAAPKRTQRTVPNRVAFGPMAARYIGLGILAVIALVMLTQQSTRATGAYQENGLNQQISQASSDVAALQLEAKRAQSLQTLESSQTAAGMQPATSVNYVETGSVAGVSTAAPTSKP